MAISKTKYLALFLGEFRENLLSAENQIILLKNDQAQRGRPLHSPAHPSQHEGLGPDAPVRQYREPGPRHGDDLQRSAGRPLSGGQPSRAVLFHRRRSPAVRRDSIERGEGDAIAGPGAPRPGLREARRERGLRPHRDPALPAPAGDRGAGRRRGRASDAPREEAGQSEAGEDEARPIRLDSSIRVDSETIDGSISLVNTLTVRQLRLRAADDELESIGEEAHERRIAAGKDVKIPSSGAGGPGSRHAALSQPILRAAFRDRARRAGAAGSRHRNAHASPVGRSWSASPHGRGDGLRHWART